MGQISIASVFKNITARLPLFIIIFIILLSALPTISNNIDKPNLITYFNADEGGQMDLIWWYYSGQKRDSFQWDFDYGLEMLYLADFSRLALAKFIHITPGVFVLILRWLNLLAWLLALAALWNLVRRHFGDGVHVLLATVLLASRPAFSYLSFNLKPEPLVLLIMIIGIDYTLRIIDRPFLNKNLYIAAAFAALAFLVKYAGLFLLPAIISAMYFSARLGVDANDKQPKLSLHKIAWAAPLFLGLIIIILPLVTVFCYVRKSTGLTWYEQFGFWGSLSKNKPIVYLLLAGIILFVLPLIIYFLRKTRVVFMKNMLKLIDAFNYHLAVTCVLFTGFIFLFGLRWIINPKHFINIYAQLGPTASSNPAIAQIGDRGLFSSFLSNLIYRINTFDSVIFTVFLAYLCLDLISQQGMASLAAIKRKVLLIFLVLPFLAIFFMVHMEAHHMLPFFAVTAVLASQIFSLLNSAPTLHIKKQIKNILAVCFGILFAIDIGLNFITAAKSRFYQLRQHEDIAFEIGNWWQANVKADTKVVADHYIRAYIPNGYKGVKTLNWNEKDRALRLRQLVDEYHPELVYYNQGPNSADSAPMPPVELILPDKKIELVKTFENKPGHYARREHAKFVIYRILN